MTPLPRLTIALASMAPRLGRLQPADLPVIPGVLWHLFVQGAPEEIAPHAARLTRADVRLSHTEGQGAARNRNAALADVDTPLLLFADDDLVFHPTAILALMAEFDARPAADILCARLEDETGRPRKRYSRHGRRLRWFNGGKVGTPELALRPDRVRAKGIGFDPRFGAGAPDWLGDEYIFLCDALRAGLRGWHVDLTLARHPAESSGTKTDPATTAIRRRVLIRAFGRWQSLPLRLAFALRHRKSFDLRGVLAFLRP